MILNKTLPLLLFLATSLIIYGQQNTITFKSFGLEVDTFVNNSPQDTFKVGLANFPNDYTMTSFGGFWSGWSISTKNDTVTPGFGNQYSAFTNDSLTDFGLAYVGDPVFLNFDSTVLVKEAKFTNSTYVVRSLLEGDQFAKKFGGPSGDDPDFLYISIYGFRNGIELADSINFFLADYRFEDNRQDYIIKDWTSISLEELGPVDSLKFKMFSSDMNGVFLNTPAYFCMDNMIYERATSTSTETISSLSVRLYPNPAQDFIKISKPDMKTYPANGLMAIYTIDGQCILKQPYTYDEAISIELLRSGMYYLVIQFGNQYGKGIFLKN